MPKPNPTLSVSTLLVIGTALIGCNDAPTAAPDPVATQPPVVLMFEQTQFGFDTRTSTLKIWGIWMARIGSNWNDVTADATLESRAPEIVSVLGPGRVAGLSPGDAELRVTYRGKTITPLLRVFPGEPPLWVVRASDDPLSLGCFVGDSPTDRALVGARAEILTGHNAGRSAVSDTQGQYRFETPFVCGPATIRFTAPGYRDLTESRTLCPSTFPCPRMTPVQ